MTETAENTTRKPVTLPVTPFIDLTGLLDLVSGITLILTKTPDTYWNGGAVWNLDRGDVCIST